MSKPLASLSQWALMLLISSFLFVEFFRLNDWLFSALEHTHGVNWIFLPAGFRILLVLVFGMPGALGIVYALVNAVSHQLIRWTFQPETAKPWLDVWPMFIGDAIGALVMLYVMKLSLPWFRQQAYKRV